MFDRANAATFDDLWLPLSRRSGRGVYFVRVCGWTDEARAAAQTFCGAARRRGAALEGPLPNPDGGQLKRLGDVLGADFRPEEGFIADALSKWTPRLRPEGRQAFARGLCREMESLRRSGKSESMLKNLYCKLMCWLYYSFERVTPLLGEDDPPRVLRAGAALSAHELVMLRLLNAMGADVMLLEPAGDAAYLRHDPESAHSQLLAPPGKPFPPDFSLKTLREEPVRRPEPAAPRVVPAPAPARVKPTPPPPRKVDPLKYFKAPVRTACTNAWMKEADYSQILTPPAQRGDDFRFFYNAFILEKGVRDQLGYLSGLHQFYRQLQDAGRRVVVVDGGLDMPKPEEIARIRRRGYRSPEEMAVDLAPNLPASASEELQRQMQRAFVEALMAAVGDEPNLSRLLVSAVYLLCWINRFQGPLFQGYKDGDIPCFIAMGGCGSAHEALFMRYLSRLPVDVLILAPDLNKPCALSDERLLELTGEESMSVDRFPRELTQVSTVAANAEADLNDMLYADSGLYRSRQLARAEALTLKSTSDEVFLLWNEELKYRSGFDSQGQTAVMPVLYAKLSGVPKGKPEPYWQRVRTLIGDDVQVVHQLPMLAPGAASGWQDVALKALRGGRLNREALRANRRYPFGIYREALQNHILDKLQLMLDRRLIKGTFENGTEYTVAATVLSLDKGLMRQLQSFDFTRRNPKLLCVNAGERGGSLEDAIMITFLNLVGFDIAMFVPTGYQVIEQYLNDNFPVEHQLGEYMYDLQVPDLTAPPQQKGFAWFNNLFGRGM